MPKSTPQPKSDSVIVQVPTASATAAALAPTVVTSRPRRETWVDWAGPDAPIPADKDQLTRDEVIERLQAEGIEVSPRDLTFWQTSGALPYPLKRREQGVTYGYFAPWVVDLIRELRWRQRREGRTLAEIIPSLRVFAMAIATTGRVDATATVAVGTVTATGSTLTASDGSLRGTSGGEGSASGELMVTPGIFATLASAIAQAYRDRYGTPIRKIDIRLFDERNNPVEFSFQTDESH